MNNTKKQKTSAGKLILKSAAWTLIALSLMGIGFWGAKLLFG